MDNLSEHNSNPNPHQIEIGILLVLVYFSCGSNTYIGNIISTLLHDESYRGEQLTQIITFIITTILMMIFPYIMKKMNGNKLEYKKGKMICLLNSLFWFVLTIIGIMFNKIGVIGGLGAISFYFINKWLFVEERK